MFGASVLEQGRQHLPAADWLGDILDGQEHVRLDEVNDIISNGGVVQKAFWLVVEGFSEDSFNALSAGVPTPTGAFASVQGVTITQNPDIDFENGVDPSAQQRIRIPFDITFVTRTRAISMARPTPLTRG